MQVGQVRRPLSFLLRLNVIQEGKARSRHNNVHAKEY